MPLSGTASGRPLMINSVSGRGHRQILLATFSRPETAFRQLMSPFQATRRRNLSLGSTAAAARDRRPLPARMLVDGYAQFAQTCRASASGIVDACGPGSPDSHRVVWGLTSRPPVPRGLSSGFPFARRVLPSRPPSPGFPSSGVLRFVPFGRRPGFGSPVGVPPGSLPLSNLHDSAAAGRFRRRWSRAARAKVTSPAATTPRLDLAVIRPALQMGNGWARCDAATESPVTSGRERRTPPRPNRPYRRIRRAPGCGLRHAR
jgi:hypothetical protein